MNTLIHKFVLIAIWILFQYFGLNAQVLNIDSLFISKPSEAERDEIINSFHITLKDGDESYAKWNLYDSYNFNTNSNDPSIYPLINTLRVIREQKFSEPLPVAPNVYQYMLLNLQSGGIELSLRPGVPYQGGNEIYLPGYLGFWNYRSGSEPFTHISDTLYDYPDRVLTLVHETRHIDSDAPRHVAGGMDQNFSSDGAYTRQVIYAMWVYKYGINNSDAIKSLYGNIAEWRLIDGFVEMPPTHPNPKIQQLIDEVIPKIKIQDGNNQVGALGKELTKTLQVNVYTQVEGSIFPRPFEVLFRVISVPKDAKGYSLSSDRSTSRRDTIINSAKPAEVSFKLGDKPGIYLISARAPILGKDSVIFSVSANQVSIANAGVDQSVNEGELVTLDGSESSNPDGNPLIYEWTVPAGIALSSKTAVNPTFTAPEVNTDTSYTFSLVVSDGDIDSPFDQVVITVKNVIKVGSTKISAPVIKVYPNPSIGIITFELNHKSEKKTEISVLNLIGDEIFRKELTNVDTYLIDLSNQISGIYFLKVSIDNQQYINKFVIQKQ